MTDILNPQAHEAPPFADETVTAEAKERLRRLFRQGGTPDEAAPNATAADASNGGSPLSASRPALLLQAEDTLLQDKTYLGDIYGPGCAESGYYYLLANDASGNPAGFPRLGRIVSSEEYRTLMTNPDAALEGCTLFGAFVDGCWVFRMLDEARSYLHLMPFGLVTRLFSRNKGLLESDSMLDKTAVIVGQGSAGSMVALYLARSGVGRFILVDRDVLDLHNICRHQLDAAALGQYKVDAMRDAILRINPKAQVTVFRGWLEEAPMALFSDVKDGIVVGTADDRAANALANELAGILSVPFTAVGGWTRCHAGEVFYWLPDRGLPTYGESFRELIAEAKRDTKPDHTHYFADPEDMEKLNFEPGTAVDLGFITMVELKFILDLINLNNPRYTTRVLDDHTHYTLICNTNKPEIGGETAAMFPKSLYISDNITLSGEMPCA